MKQHFILVCVRGYFFKKYFSYKKICIILKIGATKSSFVATII